MHSISAGQEAKDLEGDERREASDQLDGGDGVRDEPIGQHGLLWLGRSLPQLRAAGRHGELEV